MVEEKVLPLGKAEGDAELLRKAHTALELAMQDAAKKADWKGVRECAKKLEEFEKAAVQAEKDAKLKALAGTTLKVKQAIDKLVQKMVDAKELDFADGIWYSYDFGSTDTACRLMKSAPKKTGTSSGKYVSRPEKTNDLLAQVGDNVMFKEDTVATVDKVETTIAAGTTFKEAYELSTNGNWRYRVRMALLKEAGLV